MDTDSHTLNSERWLRDFLIFYVASLVFFAVGILTSLGLGWYATLNLPAWMPSEFSVAMVWGVLFLATVMSLSLFSDGAPAGRATRTTVGLYMLNALLIMLWNYLFFGVHLLLPAVCAAGAVGFSVLVLIARTRKVSCASALLLAPYLIWVAVAIFINYQIFIMN